jgi:hypothetical protein
MWTCVTSISRTLIDGSVVHLVHEGTDTMVADILTKPLGPEKFLPHAERMLQGQVTPVGGAGMDRVRMTGEGEEVCWMGACHLWYQGDTGPSLGRHGTIFGKERGLTPYLPVRESRVRQSRNTVHCLIA